MRTAQQRACATGLIRSAWQCALLFGALFVLGCGGTAEPPGPPAASTATAVDAEPAEELTVPEQSEPELEPEDGESNVSTPDTVEPEFGEEEPDVGESAEAGRSTLGAILVNAESGRDVAGADLFAEAQGDRPVAAPATPAEEEAGAAESGADEGVAEGKPTGVAGRKAKRYEFRKMHDPNGIGKFYMGREIAHVMGYPAAVWLERPEREAEESITKMVDALKLQPGMVVADIGAGSGVITLMMAGQVGEKGLAIAVDVQQQMLDLLAKKLKVQKVENVELVLGTAKSPRLPKESIDLALMVDVYHEFEYPYEMMVAISRALKPGGRVVFVEYRKEDPKVPIKLVHKMTEMQVKKEISQPEFGLKWKETIDILPQQHIVVFERPTADESQPLDE